MPTDDLRRAIEAIKLRTPVEDVVRERVPNLKRAGNLWVACCPFHEEKTPSFKVDPRRGTWHCFGACGTGGDQIRFVEQFDRLGFMDALEILAARAGVDLPKTRSARPDPDSNRAALELLERAQRYYSRELESAEGRAALDYQHSRGISDATAQVFGVGYAPASGQALVRALRSKSIDFALAESVGLVRKNDQGRHYDFFRGRWMIPIRDALGRTVGFGARRLADDAASGPKYVNTPDSPVFHKGRLVYALDRALPHVRKSGHVVLVEGYTDVMAAHQAGVESVVAVLGTATTDDHAALIRKTGARRVSLVFDGDEAGRNAAYKALHGLMPLAVEIDVVSLAGGMDPCDLVLRDGKDAFLAEIARARGWFDYVCDGLVGLSGLTLAREVDRVLELFARLSKPVQRDASMVELAKRLGLSIESLRAEWQTLPRRRDPEIAMAPAVPETPVAPTNPLQRKACEEAIGAMLWDPCLASRATKVLADCEDDELAKILEAITFLHCDESAEVTIASVLTALGDHPARARVVALDEAARTAESPSVLLEGALARLHKLAVEREASESMRALQAVEREALSKGGPTRAAADPHAIEFSKRLSEKLELSRGLHATSTASTTPVLTPTSHHG